MTASKRNRSVPSMGELTAGFARWPAYQHDRHVRAAVDLLVAHHGYGHWLRDETFVAAAVARDGDMFYIRWDRALRALKMSLVGSPSEVGVLTLAIDLATNRHGITSLDAENRAAVRAAWETATGVIR